MKSENDARNTYWPRAKRLFWMFGRRGLIADFRVRQAWGVMWRGGFVGLLLTEREEKTNEQKEKAKHE